LISEFNELEQGEQKGLFEKAMLFASCAAFLCITKHGAMPSLPKKTEVDEFMMKYNLK
jgi:sugar/nucleoside kinase (ribokinase family)